MHFRYCFCLSVCLVCLYVAVPATLFVYKSNQRTLFSTRRYLYMLKANSMYYEHCTKSPSVIVSSSLCTQQPVLSDFILRLFPDGVWLSVHQQAGGNVQGHCSLQHHHGEIQGIPPDQLSTCSPVIWHKLLRSKLTCICGPKGTITIMYICIPLCMCFVCEE